MFETPLGEIDWRHVTGDSDALPFPSLGLVQTPAGFAAVSDQGVPSRGQEGVRYWQSSNGYEWSASTLPVPVEPASARMYRAGEAIWLITFGPETLWRSADGETWTEVGIPDGSGTWGPINDLDIYDVDGATWLIRGSPPGAFILDGSTWIEVGTSVLQPPDITGGRWRIVTPSSPVAVSGTTIVPWPVAFDVDWVSILGVDPNPYPNGFWNAEMQRLKIWGSEGAGPLATLDAEVTGRQITFIDPDSGEEVHQIVVNDPRIDPTTLLEDGVRVGEYQMAVMNEQGPVVASDIPWGEPSSDWGEPFRGARAAALFATDQFVALIPTGEGEGVGTWTSSNGSDWSESGQPEFIRDQDLPGLVRFYVEGDVVLADVMQDYGNEIWVSLDGTTWAFSGIGGGTGTWSLARIGSGGLYYRDFDLSSGGMAVSADLRQWEFVDPGLEPHFGEEAGGSGGFSAGNTFFYVEARDSGTRQMYVLKLQS